MVGLNLLIILIGGVAIFGGIAIAFFSTMRKTARDHSASSSSQSDSLSVDSLGLYRPFRVLVSEIRDQVSESKDPATKAMKSAVFEHVDEVEQRVLASLSIRDQLKKAAKDASTARAEAERLLEQRDRVDSAPAKLQVTQAYEARLGELAEYDKASKIIERIEHDVQLLQANLSSLKAKLSVSSASVQSSTKADELRTALGSLDALQASVEEAQQFLKVD
jgi:hypothetical protein